MILGGSTITWPEDIGGRFTINGLAQGSYTIRFLSTLPYPVLDTTFNVISGKINDIGTITLKNN
jgi:hypothetical protein